MRSFLFAALLSLSACGPLGGFDGTCDTSNEDCGPGRCGGEGSTMLPGSDCLACHENGVEDEDEDRDEDERFTIGGTVFAGYDGGGGLSGAIVRVTDANGTVVELTSNRVGNFFSGQALTPPLQAEVEVDGQVIAMADTVDSGACNTCHSCDGSAGGKLTGP